MKQHASVDGTPLNESNKTETEYSVKMLLTVCIKVMVAMAPAKFPRKWRNKVKYDPSDNNHVINGDKRNDN